MTPELEKDIRKAARSVAFQWPTVVEQDDVEQEIHLRLLESSGSVEKLQEMDPKARYRAVVGMGHQIASQERTDYDHFKGSYRYSVKEVKDLLSQGILTEVLPSFKAEKLDIADALEGIPEQYREAVERRYITGDPTTGDREYHNRFTRGVESLVEEMNRVQRRRYSERDDGPGTRSVITVEQASYLSQSDYDNDLPVLEAGRRDNYVEPEVWYVGKWK